MKRKKRGRKRASGILCPPCRDCSTTETKIKAGFIFEGEGRFGEGVGVSHLVTVSVVSEILT